MESLESAVIVNGGPAGSLAGSLAAAQPLSARRLLRIGLVNNMPDAAFEETYIRFRDLLCSEACQPVELTSFALPSVLRGQDVLRRSGIVQLPVEELSCDPPDALVITGSEPRAGRLEHEPYWAELSELLIWATEAVPSVMLSCLAAHAALLALYGIRRVRLPRKRSGVYVQAVSHGCSLGDGLGATVALPHSRLNDVPSAALAERGFEVLIEGKDSGWSVAVLERPGRQLVLLQGHPEYARTTLLKEYRRDVRRYLDGVSDRHPDIPVGYLDPIGVGILEIFRDECFNGTVTGRDFPMADLVPHVRADWSWAAAQLFTNWTSLARAGLTGAAPYL